MFCFSQQKSRVFVQLHARVDLHSRDRYHAERILCTEYLHMIDKNSSQWWWVWRTQGLDKEGYQSFKPVLYRISLCNVYLQDECMLGSTLRSSLPTPSSKLGASKITWADGASVLVTTIHHANDIASISRELPHISQTPSSTCTEYIGDAERALVKDTTSLNPPMDTPTGPCALAAGIPRIA